MLARAAAFFLCFAAAFFDHTLSHENSITIHIIPHTHDDVGWLRTVDEYYNYEVQYILDEIVDALLKDEARRFIYVEMAFFKRWWIEQDDVVKKSVQTLVREGRLEFVLGGHVMNDEATTHYTQVIDQMTYGHAFLLETFNIQPSKAWHIDPFGSSNVIASLWAQVGFDGFVINRIDYREKASRRANQEMEFYWRGSHSRGAASDIFTHVLYTHYCTPEGFEWEHGVNQMIGADGDEPIITHATSKFTVTNVHERAVKFIEMARNRSLAYQTPHVLIPLGCDFNFQNARMKFKNMDRLIRYINDHTDSLGAKAQYSTLSQFFSAVRSYPLGNSSWPYKFGDFFPYADNSASYWTGYFTSHPALKILTREAGVVLRKAEIAFILVSLYEIDLPNRSQHYESLQLLRDAIATVQHHDGVTGTAMAAVVADYGARLKDGIALGDQLFKDSILLLLKRKPSDNISSRLRGHRTDSFISTDDNGEDENLFIDPTETADLHMTKESAEEILVVAVNPVAYSRVAAVGLKTDLIDATVGDSEGNLIPSQIVEPHSPTGAMYRYFVASVPALGYSTYSILSAENRTSVDSTTGHSLSEPLEENSPVDSLRVNSPLNDEIFIENEFYKLEFDSKSGLLTSVFLKRIWDKPLSLNQGFLWYPSSTNSTQPSGAYIFRPSGPAQALDCHFVRRDAGPVLQQVISYCQDMNVTQTTRVYLGLEEPFVELLQEVGPILGNAELITRFESDINSRDTFYTDTNGLEMQERHRLDTGRPDDADEFVSLAGNYYPVVSKAYICDQSRQLTVLTPRTIAATSLASGQLEFMLHRRTLQDDFRGVQQGLNDTSTISTRLWIIIDQPIQSTRLHRLLSPSLEYPIQTLEVASPSSSLGDFYKRLSPVGSSLPDSIHLMTLQPRDSSGLKVTLRLQHLFEVGEHSLSKSAHVDLQRLFSDARLDKLVETSMTANRVLKEEIEADDLLLSPMQIRTFTTDMLPVLI